MRVDLSGRYTFMSQHFLHRPQVGATFYQMRGKRMPEGMWGDIFFNACFFCKFFQHYEDHHPG